MINVAVSSSGAAVLSTNSEAKQNALTVVSESTKRVGAIRTRSGLSINPAVIEKKLIEASGGLPIGKVLPMDAILSRSTTRSDFTTPLLAVFGDSALVLAAIGMYGLMAYSVEQRTQEIRIRMALGAGIGEMQRMIVIQGMRLVIVGAVLGVAGAYWLTRFLTSFLFGVRSRDRAAFLTVLLFLSLSP